MSPPLIWWNTALPPQIVRTAPATTAPVMARILPEPDQVGSQWDTGVHRPRRRCCPASVGSPAAAEIILDVRLAWSHDTDDVQGRDQGCRDAALERGDRQTRLRAVFAARIDSRVRAGGLAPGRGRADGGGSGGQGPQALTTRDLRP